MIAEDKIKHFIVGAIIFIISIIFGLSQLVGLIFVSAVAVGKEVYDQQYPEIHSVELFDVLATVAGGIVMIILLEVIRIVV
jgi:hypothetical protein